MIRLRSTVAIPSTTRSPLKTIRLDIRRYDNNEENALQSPRVPAIDHFRKAIAESGKLTAEGKK